MRKSLNRLALAVALTAAAVPVLAQTEAKGPQLDGPHHPPLEWSRRPTGGDFVHYYPEHALRTGRSGEAEVRCKTTSQGLLIDCVVLAETPEGEGFGPAAVNLARLFQIRVRAGYSGEIGGATINIPIRFSLGNSIGPRLSLNDGRRASLVTAPTKGAPAHNLFRCPSRTDPNRMCQKHAIELSRGLSPEKASAILAKGGLQAGVSILECGLDGDGKPVGCRFDGLPTPAAEAAATDWANQLRFRDKAQDGTSAANGHILLEINWAAVN